MCLSIMSKYGSQFDVTLYAMRNESHGHQIETHTLHVYSGTHWHLPFSLAGQSLHCSQELSVKKANTHIRAYIGI